MEDSSKSQTQTLFAGGLNPDTTEEGLKTFVSKFAPVISVRMPMKENQSRCIAFIDVKDRETGMKIITAFQQKRRYLDERPITMEFSNKSSKDKEKRARMRLHMKNIPKNAQNKEIEQSLNLLGLKIRSAYQIFSQNGSPKGYGFIDFWDENDAQGLLEEGFFLLKGKKILLEPYQPKGSKKSNIAPQSRKQTNNNHSYQYKGDPEGSKGYQRYGAFPNKKKNYSDKKKNSFVYYEQKYSREYSNKNYSESQAQNYARRDSFNDHQSYHNSGKKVVKKKRNTNKYEKYSQKKLEKNIPSLENIMGNIGSNYLDNRSSIGKINSSDPPTGNQMSQEFFKKSSEALKSNQKEDLNTVRMRMKSEPFFEVEEHHLTIEHTGHNWPVSENCSPLIKNRISNIEEFEHERVKHFCRENEDDKQLINVCAILDYGDERKKVFNWSPVVKEIASKANLLPYRNQNLRLNKSNIETNTFLNRGEYDF